MNVSIKQKEYWSNLALISAILSLISSILFLPINDAPLGIILAIFSFSFAINSKNQNERFNKKTIISIVLASLSFAIGLLFFIISIQFLKVMQNPALANSYLLQLREFINQLPENIRFKLNEFYGF